MMRSMLKSAARLASLCTAVCLSAAATAQPLTGAIFTTDQCGSQVNGNIYDLCCPPSPIVCPPEKSTRAPFLNGGPPPHAPCTSAGLPDGDYYFQVTDPSGATLLSTDPVENRRVTVLGGLIIGYAGTHATGPGKCVASNPANISVALCPMDPTPNPGGVYKAWMTRVTDYAPADPHSYFGFLPPRSKTDNFKAPCGSGTDPFNACVVIRKYCDQNANGTNDGEAPLDGFHLLVTAVDGHGNIVLPLLVSDPNSGCTEVAAAPPYITGNLCDGPGEISVCAPSGTFLPITFTVCEVLPGGGTGTWIQTEPSVLSGSTSCAEPVVISGQYCWRATVNTVGGICSVDVGNTCIGGSCGGLTMGFWSNRNGQGVLTTCAGGMAANLNFLSGLCLRNANGSDFNPASYPQYRTWLLSANAVNMAYMLSAQLSAMEFNIREAGCLGSFGGGVSAGHLIYAPGTNSANALGFATIGAVVAEAEAELCLHGSTPDGSAFRAYQEALKNALDNANNNRNCVQGCDSPCPIIYK